MVDFIKCYILNPSFWIRSLDYCVELHYKTGNPKVTPYKDPQGRFVSETVVYKYENQGITFIKKQVKTIYAGGLVSNKEYFEFSGSLHKYKNQGKYNFDRFTFQDLVEVVSEICIKYQIDPKQIHLTKLEFGLNISLGVTAKKYLSLIKCLKRKPQSIEMFPDGGQMIVFDFTQHTLKCYDKGTQNQKEHKTSSNLFRFEIHAKKAQYFNRIGIKTLADLLIKDKIEMLGNDLLKTHEQLVLFDGTKRSKSNKRNTMIANMKNRDFWRELNNDQFKRYKEYLNDPDFNRYHNLTNVIYNTLKKEIELVLTERRKHPRFYHFEENQNTLDFTPSIQGKYKGINAQLCLITKNDISDQKNGSRFLSANKVGYKIAHDLRNADSNPRNNLKKRILKPNTNNQSSLFGIFDYLILDNIQQEIAGNISFDKSSFNYGY
jgi:hypothetical protein